MSAGTICRRDVCVAELSDSVRSAAQRMRDHDVGTVVVRDERGRPAGVLTDRDIALRVVAEDRDPVATPVVEVMTVVPKCVREEATVESVLALMRAVGCRRIPVIGRDDELVGLISLDDVLELLAEEFGTIGRLVRAEPPRD
jgi:CBS domain-containing protein